MNIFQTAESLDQSWLLTPLLCFFLHVIGNKSSSIPSND